MKGSSDVITAAATSSSTSLVSIVVETAKDSNTDLDRSPEETDLPDAALVLPTASDQTTPDSGRSVDSSTELVPESGPLQSEPETMDVSGNDQVRI